MSNKDFRSDIEESWEKASNTFKKFNSFLYHGWFVDLFALGLLLTALPGFIAKYNEIEHLEANIPASTYVVLSSFLTFFILSKSSQGRLRRALLGGTIFCTLMFTMITYNPFPKGDDHLFPTPPFKIVYTGNDTNPRGHFYMSSEKKLYFVLYLAGDSSDGSKGLKFDATDMTIWELKTKLKKTGYLNVINQTATSEELVKNLELSTLATIHSLIPENPDSLPTCEYLASKRTNSGDAEELRRSFSDTQVHIDQEETNNEKKEVPIPCLSRLNGEPLLHYVLRKTNLNSKLAKFNLERHPFIHKLDSLTFRIKYNFIAMTKGYSPTQIPPLPKHKVYTSGLTSNEFESIKEVFHEAFTSKRINKSALASSHFKYEIKSNCQSDELESEYKELLEEKTEDCRSYALHQFIRTCSKRIEGKESKRWPLYKDCSNDPFNFIESELKNPKSLLSCRSTQLKKIISVHCLDKSNESDQSETTDFGSIVKISDETLRNKYLTLDLVSRSFIPGFEAMPHTFQSEKGLLGTYQKLDSNPILQKSLLMDAWPFRSDNWIYKIPEGVSKLNYDLQLNRYLSSLRQELKKQRSIR